MNDVNRNYNCKRLVSLLNGTFRRLARLWNHMSRKLCPDGKGLQLDKWYQDHGDSTHRIYYDLGEESVVFDLGGYQGQWTSDIFAKYMCIIHVFEPVPEYFSNICRRFSRNPNIFVYNFGLADETKVVRLYLNCDSSSVYKPSASFREVTVRKAADFMKERNIAQVNLMKINIEGGEYDLLEHLLSEGLVRKIENIQIQFHDFVPEAEKRMFRIQEKLSQTHFLTYQYRFVWENWRIRSKQTPFLNQFG